MSRELTRRDFLQGGAVVAGGALLCGGLPASASAEEASAAAAAEGRFRPSPNSRTCPSPTTTGYIGPDAQPVAPLAAPASWDEEYDLVVVGSGFGGLTASIIGATEGLKVALIEKGDVTGGASRHAAGNLIAPGGSKLQEAAGYHWPGDKYDPMAAAAKVQEYSQYTIDTPLLLASIEAGKDWADWMTDLPGLDWVCVGPAYMARDVAETGNWHIGNNPIANALTDNATSAGVDIKLLTECDALVKDGDRIVGIKVSDVNGQESFLKAKKAVLLTAGGFGVNLDLLEQYTPTAYMYATQGGPMWSHTGDCFRMGIGAGADVAGFNSFSMWEGGLDEYWGNGDGEFFHYFNHAEKHIAQNPWLKIDKFGNRLEFITHMSSDGVPMKNWTFETISIGDLTNAAKWSSSCGHRAYNIMDSNFEASLEIFLPTAGSWLDPHRYPVQDDGMAPPNSLFNHADWRPEWEDAIARGAISKADTLEELAEMLGLNPDKVKKAVDHWNNEICAKGEDTDLPVPYKKEWLIPVSNPPYYGFALGGQISKTMCGLRVNPKMQVVDPEGDPIPGLYAGFYTAGGIAGENNYGGQWGNPTLHGGVAISGVGGYMAINGILAEEL